MLMILVNLGQRSCNSRTTFPKYTDSVLVLFGQGTLSQRDKLTSFVVVYHMLLQLSSAGG